MEISGIKGAKTVKDILHCSEEDKECKDYLNLYIRSIHKINRPVPDVHSVPKMKLG